LKIMISRSLLEVERDVRRPALESMGAGRLAGRGSPTPEEA
jgi:hypothetical protein